jgi:hypothetical protein
MHRHCTLVLVGCTRKAQSLRDIERGGGMYGGESVGRERMAGSSGCDERAHNPAVLYMFHADVLLLPYFVCLCTFVG